MQKHEEEHKHNIKSQKEKRRNKEEIQNQPENKGEMAIKNVFINNYLKCQWIKCTNQETHSGRLDNKTRVYNMLPTRD